MVAVEQPRSSEPSDEERDQRVCLRTVGWSLFEALLEARGESAVPRMSYLEGELELMNPSKRHESINRFIARLIEAYADEAGIDLYNYGSWTLKSEPEERALEADTFFALRPCEDDEIPDLAIEVTLSRSALDKLEIYRGLGVREVWIWDESEIHAHAPEDGVYVRVERSRLLPNLELSMLASFAERKDQPQAVREFRAMLR